jgi:hypothetical protein
MGSVRKLIDDRALESRKVSYVRDVGVAGPNPGTPTVDFKDIFRSTIRWGAISGLRANDIGSTALVTSEPCKVYIPIAESRTRLNGRS